MARTRRPRTPAEQDAEFDRLQAEFEKAQQKRDAAKAEAARAKKNLSGFDAIAKERDAYNEAMEATRPDVSEDNPANEEQPRSAFEALEEAEERAGTANRSLSEAEAEVAMRGDALRRRHYELDLRPHQEQLAKFLQNAIRTLAGLSIGLVTAALTVAGIVVIDESQADRFRSAYISGIGGLALSFLYFLPLLAVHLFDMRYNLDLSDYRGRLAGRSTNFWALGLAAAVALLQMAAWAFGMYELARLAWEIEISDDKI